MKRKQSNKKLIPSLPFSREEINHYTGPQLQDKLMSYSRTKDYQFLCNLINNNIKTPLPNTKLTKKEMQLFNEYVKFRSSMEYEVFLVVQQLIEEYQIRLGSYNRMEDTTEDFEEPVQRDELGRIIARKMEDIDRRYNTTPGVL